MTSLDPLAPSSAPSRSREWIRILARYREPSDLRSAAELLATLAPFLGLAALAWWAISISPVLAAAISIPNAGFLVRLFIIQHDCGHGSLFHNRHANDWIGRVLGVLTLTPYDVWRRTHSIHHASSGNLDRRGIGDLPTLTVAEYRSRSRLGRLAYRIYRNPFFLFGVAPAFLFLLHNRLPVGLMRSGPKYWISAMATNAGIIAAIGLGVWFSGILPVLVVVLPTALVGASIGVWLFYIQHQFEDTRWDRERGWDLHESALHGSSHYLLPPVVRWFTANIGIHHVHHLYSRIPFYRLPEVLRDYPALAMAQRLTLIQSFRCARLHLWDESRRKLVGFSEAWSA